MKKSINKSIKAQARRQRALDRFTISGSRAAGDAHYAARKAEELAALRAALGHAG